MGGLKNESSRLRSRSEKSEMELTEEQRRLFEKEVVVHCKSLYRYLCKNSRDYELSHDIMQETMIVAQKYYASGLRKEAGAVCFWLQRIARNLLVSHFRMSMRRHAMLNAHRSQICDNLGWNASEYDRMGRSAAGSIFSDADTRDAVRKEKVSRNIEVLMETGFCAFSLTVEEVALLRGRHVQQKAFKELASSLGKPISTVMSRYYALMKRLQRNLYDWESEGLLDKELSKKEMYQLAKVREKTSRKPRRAGRRDSVQG